MSGRGTSLPLGSSVRVPAKTMAYLLMAAEIGLGMGVDEPTYGPAIQEAWMALASAAPEVTKGTIFAIEGHLPVRAGQLQHSLAGVFGG